MHTIFDLKFQFNSLIVLNVFNIMWTWSERPFEHALSYGTFSWAYVSLHRQRDMTKIRVRFSENANGQKVTKCLWKYTPPTLKTSCYILSSWRLFGLLKCSIWLFNFTCDQYSVGSRI